MGYLLHILAALFVLALAQTELPLASDRPFVLVFLPLVPYALGRWATWLLVRGRFRLGALVERALGLSPVALHLVAILLGGWVRLSERLFGVGVDVYGWPGLQLAVGMAPFVLFELLAIDARARLHAAAGAGLQRVRAFQVRMFLSACVPFGLFVAAMTLVGTSDSLRVHIEEVSLLNLAFTALLAAGFVACLPAVLRRTWDTAALEQGELRSLLEDVARQAGFRCKELLVWRTGHQMANAAILGFTPRGRLVLFSDALVAQLRPLEIASVFAHEIGHAKRHHAAVFGGFAILFLVGADLALTWLDLGSEVLVGLCFLGMLSGWYLAFGYLSRRFELEADLESVEVIGASGPLIDALQAVTGAHAHERSSWRHFSTSQRVEFLDRVERDPGVARVLRRKLRWVERVAAVLVVIALGLEVFLLSGRWGTERTVAQLRLGRYDGAAARVAAGIEVEDELRTLVERAAGLPALERSPAALEEYALRELDDGRTASALELLDLALLRGRMSLAPVRDELGRILDDDGAAPEDLSELDPRWRAALERIEDKRPPIPLGQPGQ